MLVVKILCFLFLGGIYIYDLVMNILDKEIYGIVLESVMIVVFLFIALTSFMRW